MKDTLKIITLMLLLPAALFAGGGAGGCRGLPECQAADPGQEKGRRLD